MDHYLNPHYPPPSSTLVTPEPAVHLSAMSTIPSSDHLNQGQSNHHHHQHHHHQHHHQQYLLAKDIDAASSSHAFNSSSATTSSSTSTLLSANEIISQSSNASAASAGYSSASAGGAYLSGGHHHRHHHHLPSVNHETNMYNTSSTTTTIVSNNVNVDQSSTGADVSRRKSKKSHHHRERRQPQTEHQHPQHLLSYQQQQHQQQQQQQPAPPALTGYPHHHPVHHYVQQTESVIISTRKLSVVESVPIAGSAVTAPYVGVPSSGAGADALHQTSCNITNYSHQHHAGNFSGGQSSAPAVPEGYHHPHHHHHHQHKQQQQQQQSAAINSLLMNQAAVVASSASSLNLHCPTEMATLAHQLQQHCQTTSNSTTSGSGQTSRSHRHKKKRKHRKEKEVRHQPLQPFFLSHSSTPSQPFPSNLYDSTTGIHPSSQALMMITPANCDSAKCVFTSSSSSSTSSTSQSHSSGSSSNSFSSSSSDEEDGVEGRTKAGQVKSNKANYDSYQRKEKQKTKQRSHRRQPNSSFSSSNSSSFSSNSGSSASSSSSSSSSSYSSGSSSDEEGEGGGHRNKTATSSSSTGSSSTSRSSSCSTKSSSKVSSASTVFYGHDVLKAISVHDNLTDHENDQLSSSAGECNSNFFNANSSEPVMVNENTATTTSASVVTVTTFPPVNATTVSEIHLSNTGSQQQQQQQDQFSPSFQGTSFSVNTFIQQQQQQQQGEEPLPKVNLEVTSASSSSTLNQQQQQCSTSSASSIASPLNPTLVSLVKQANTPLSSAVLSDDCNSIGSPLSVGSSGRDSGKDDSAKLGNLKKRDPAEERQRLRSYRIPHHLSQSRSLSRSSEAATTNSTTVSTNAASSSSSSGKTTASCTQSKTATESASTTATTSAVTSSSQQSATSNKKDRSSASIKSTASSTTQNDKTASTSSISSTNSSSNKRPVATVSSVVQSSGQSVKTLTSAPVLAPSHAQPSPFLNSSFFVPGPTSTFPYSQHYPFSPAAFMPTLFPNQFLQSTPQQQAANSKALAAAANAAVACSVGQQQQQRHQPFLHPAQSQSLTIFTSPTLTSNASAHALSPFAFPAGLSPMAHSALLSPTFSSSALSNAVAAGTTPLLVGSTKSLNFSPNFSFPAGTLDPLMMAFGITSGAAAAAAAAATGSNNKGASGTATSSSSSASNSSGGHHYHHTPTQHPFILPRIVPNSSSSASIISPSVSLGTSSRSSSSSRSKASSSASATAKQQQQQQLQQQQQQLLKSSLLTFSTSQQQQQQHQLNQLANNPNNAQLSPSLSTIFQQHPQTLFLLPPTLPSSSFAPTKSPLTAVSTAVTSSQPSSVSSSAAADRPSLIVGSSSSSTTTSMTTSSTTSSKTLAPSSKNVSTVVSSNVQQLASIPPTSSPLTVTTTLPPASFTSAALRAPNPLANSFIFSPNSNPHLPYTLFSPPHPHQLMQPISIQAPPPPSPSSLLGTQLLLSVISPTHRNQTVHLGSPISSGSSSSGSALALAAQPITVPSTQPAAKAGGSKQTSTSTSTTSEKPTKAGSNGGKAAMGKGGESVKTESKTTPPSSRKATAKKATAKGESQGKDNRSIASSRVPFAAKTAAAAVTTSSSSKSTSTLTTLTISYPFVETTTTTATTTTNNNSSSSGNAPPSVMTVAKTPEQLPLGLTSPTSGTDEFESLVRSVNESIKSFHSSPDFYDEECGGGSGGGSTALKELVVEKDLVKKERKSDETATFNSKKMLSLMIKSNESKGTKETATVTTSTTTSSKKAPKSSLKADQSGSKKKVKDASTDPPARKSTGSQAAVCRQPLNRQSTTAVLPVVQSSSSSGKQKQLVDKEVEANIRVSTAASNSNSSKEVKGKTNKSSASSNSSKVNISVEETAIKSSKPPSKSHKSSSSSKSSSSRHRSSKSGDSKSTSHHRHSSLSKSFKAKSSSSKKRSSHKSSKSSSKKRKSKSKGRSKSKLVFDPALLARIEELIGQLSGLHISSKGSGWRSGSSAPSGASSASNLPAMFRFTMPKLVPSSISSSFSSSVKFPSRSGRSSSLRGKLTQSTAVQSTAAAASQCFLPLKKRQHRNLSEDAAAAAAAAGHHQQHQQQHSTSHRSSDSQTVKEEQTSTATPRPESSLSQSSSKSTSKRSTSTSTSTISTGTSTGRKGSTSKSKASAASSALSASSSAVKCEAPAHHPHWTSELVTASSRSTATTAGQCHTVAPQSAKVRAAASTAHAGQKQADNRPAGEKTVLLLRSHCPPPSQRTNTTEAVTAAATTALAVVHTSHPFTINNANAELKSSTSSPPPPPPPSSTQPRSRSRKKATSKSLSSACGQKKKSRSTPFAALSTEGEHPHQQLPARAATSLSSPLEKPVPSPVTGESGRARLTVTPDGRRKKRTKARKGPTSPLSVHGSSVDESSDADDEFDPDDEVLSNADVNHPSYSSSLTTTLPKQQQNQRCDLREMAKAPVKPVRVNGVHKSVEERVKAKSTSRLAAKHGKAVQVASIAAAALTNGATKIRASKKKQAAITTVPVQANEKEQTSSAPVVSNGKAKVAVKPPRKRRRTINKTGFDKPRKRNRLAPSTNKRGRPPLVSTVSIAVESKARKPSPKPNCVNGHSSQSEAKDNTEINNNINSKSKSRMRNKVTKVTRKATTPAFIISSDSCSTEVEDAPVDVKKGKLKSERFAKGKLANRSHKKLHQNSDTSDSDKRPVASSTSSSSTTSSSEEDTESGASSSVDNFPVYMVTKPSINKAKELVKKNKVEKIKSNPFTRPIPEKKYYKAAVYAKEFAELYTEESETFKTAFTKNSATAEPNTTPPVTESAQKWQVLPLPNFYKSPNQTSASSSSSPSSSSQEDEGSLSSDSSRRRSLRNKKTKSPAVDNGDGVFQCSKSTSGFTLGFDIWFQYKYNPLPSAMSSANYRRVRQNVFCDTKPVANHSSQYCNCNVPKDNDGSTGCGANCINRLMYQECWQKTATMVKGHKCTNQRIQRYEWSPGLERFMTAKRGWGIRTTELIRNGEFILEYIGEIVSDQLFERRMTERYSNDHHHYSMVIDNGIVIDGYRVANEGRFVNHSCEPNCEIQKWSVNGFHRMCMFALRDIEPYEELFYDYNFVNFNRDSQQACHCGSSKCRGIIGGKRANGISPASPVIDPDSIQPSDIAKESQNPAEKYLTKLLPLLCSKDPTWQESLPQIKNHPQIEHDETNWIFVNCKTARIKMPISQYESKVLRIKPSLNRALKQASISTQPSASNGEEQMLERSYDPNILKAFKKLKLLYPKSDDCFKNGPPFLMRNYRLTQRYYTSLSEAVPSSGKGGGGVGLDQNQNPYAKHKAVNYRSCSSNNSSDSETSEKSQGRRRSSIVRGPKKNQVKSNAEMINRMVQQAKAFVEICMKTSSFMKNKLVLLLSNVQNGDLPSTANGHVGDIHLKGTGEKRKFSQMIGENYVSDGLFDFSLILEKIKLRRLTNMDKFIEEVKSYVCQILKTVPPGFGSKKSKLSKVNGIAKEESAEENSPAFGSLLTNDQLKTLQEDTFEFLDSEIEKKKDFVEESLNWFALVDQLNVLASSNSSPLDAGNQRRLSLFSKKLHKASLPDVLPSYEASEPSEFNLLEEVEKEVINEILADHQKDVDSIPVTVVPHNKADHEEDTIRCICGILREEGKMIQCDSCKIWQHLECVEQFCTIDQGSEYHCETCQSREVSLNVLMPEHKWPIFDLNKHYQVKYYVSLESPDKKGAQIRVGDCVYIYRDSIAGTTSMNPGKRNSPVRGRPSASATAVAQLSDVEAAALSKTFLETLKEAATVSLKTKNQHFERQECIIIRVQHLAIVETTNQRILYGHHYLWPKETFHEPTRKFFDNEVLKSPNNEWAALEEVRGTCAVLDKSTFFKGKPIGFDPKDIFVCEFRVDRSAKAFSRIGKGGNGVQVSTKSYAFEMFETPRSLKRTYSPHDIPETYVAKKQKTNKKGKISDLDKESSTAVDQSQEKTAENFQLEQINKEKLATLNNLVNQLDNCAYFWYLLLDQEQKKLKQAI